MKSPLGWQMIMAMAGAVLTAAKVKAGNEPGDPPLPKPEPETASPIPPLNDHWVEKYAVIGGTDDEIADRFLVDVEKIQTQYADVLRSSRALNKLTLRSAQFNAAVKKTNGTLLTWLGRNVLGQSLSPQQHGVEMPTVEEVDEPSA